MLTKAAFIKNTVQS